MRHEEANTYKELHERNTAKQPNRIKQHKDFNNRIYKITGLCPVCKNAVSFTEKFCNQCGQRLNWRSEKLKMHFKSAETEQIDELDFFMEMLERGFTLNDFEKILDDLTFYYVKNFMEKHGLI